MQRALFIEVGFGNDGHGQNATKASVRAARNAIEFNSLPSLSELIPGGRDGMKVHVIRGVPDAYVVDVDVEQVKGVFPYGTVTVEARAGGLAAPSGVAIKELGDANDDMVIVVAHVTVGY